MRTTKGTGALALLLALAGVASAQERPLAPRDERRDERRDDTRSPGEQGRDLTRAAKSAAADVNALLDELRKKIDDFSRAGEPQAASAERDAVQAYLQASRSVLKKCDEYLAEEPRLDTRFKALRNAYDQAILFFEKSERGQRAKVEAERRNADVPAADRERNARLRERYAELYRKERALLEDERSKIDDWEKEMRRKFKVLRAKSRLLARSVEVGELMKVVAEGEAETREFVEQVKRLNATLDELLEDIARTQFRASAGEPETKPDEKRDARTGDR